MKLVVSIVLFCFLSCSKQQVNETNSAWLNSFSDEQALSLLYTSNAYQIQPTGKFIVGAGTIAKQNRERFNAPKQLETVCTVPVSGSNYVYEIKSFIDKENSNYQVLVIKDSSEKRLLEFIVPSEQFEDAREEIDKRREQWMEKSNAHRVDELVNGLYTENTLYFNYKPMIVGRDNLIKTYSYMNREQYSLQLNPICVEQVNNEIVLEIGQCSGSYDGQYILVWKKENDGEWRILLDANK